MARLHGVGLLFGVVLLCGVIASLGIDLKYDTLMKASIPPQVKKKHGMRINRVLLPQNKYGATCLDGSPPGYYISKGSGFGARNWIIYLMGGAWCTNMRECIYRAGTDLGSSNFWLDPKDPAFQTTLRRQSTFFGGILSKNSTENPLFFNWNKVMVIYCDGGSFAGDRTGVKYNSTLKLNFHGQKILDAVFDDLNAHRGLNVATTGLLMGCSAGGQAISMHCDSLAERFPPKARVKCLMDAGYFLDSPDTSGDYFFREEAQRMMKLQNLNTGFNPKCVAAMPPTLLYKCFFPQYNLQYVAHPMFIVNSVIDYAGIFVLNQAQGEVKADEVISCISSATAVFTVEDTGENQSKAESPNKGADGGGMLLNNKFRAPDGCSQEMRQRFGQYKETMLTNIQKIIKSRPSFGSFLYYDSRHCTTIYPDWTRLESMKYKLLPTLRQWFFFQ